MDNNFSSLLDRFKEGAKSMDEVYKELAHLTANYDEELKSLQKKITELELRLQNEEEKKHEVMNNLADLRKLQQINFSTIVDDLIKKPREKMEEELVRSAKKHTSSTIIATIFSIIIITALVAFFIYYDKSFNKTNITSTSTAEYQKLQNTIKDLEKKNLQYQNELKTLKNKKKEEKPKVEEKITPKQEDEKIKDIKTEVTPQETGSPLEEKEKILEKVASHIKNFNSIYKLDNKNASRLVYKMDLLDFAPIKYEDIIQELELFAKKGTYIPSKEELKIWDKQMLIIYKKMLKKVENVSTEKITDQMMMFEKYKVNDATKYGNWQYTGQKDISLVDSIKKEISRIENQINFNSN